jgi:hypothetical protein
MLVAVAVTIAALVLFAALATRRSHPRVLLVPQSTDWRQLRDPAPIAPQLLLAPHPNIETIAIRCYDARVHKGGLRVTIGVFEVPSGASSQEWIGVRLLSDPVELPSSNTQVVALGPLHGIARTGWIRGTDDEGEPTTIFANINWYVPEPSTKRVHFVAVFTEAARGDEAVAEVGALCRQVRFDRDDRRTLRINAIVGGPCVAPELTEDHSTFGGVHRGRA